MTINLAFAETSETVGTTEHSFVTDTSGPDASTTAGTFQGFFDLNALAAGDIFEIKVYETVASSSGTQRLVWKATAAGPQAEPIFATPALILGVGWDMTVKKISGTDRAIVGRIARAA